MTKFNMYVPPIVEPNPYESLGILPQSHDPIPGLVVRNTDPVPKPVILPNLIDRYVLPYVPPVVEPNPYESPGTLPPVFAPATPYVPPVVSDPYVQPVPETNLIWIIGIIILFIFMMR